MKRIDIEREANALVTETMYQLHGNANQYTQNEWDLESELIRESFIKGAEFVLNNIKNERKRINSKSREKDFR